MAVGDRTPNHLSQNLLTSSLVAQVTGAADTRTQVTVVELANTNTTTPRNVKITVYGTAAVNTVHQEITLAPKASTAITIPRVLNAGESLYAMQDAGNDVAMTTQGIVEALA